jgi:hypothetical protein
VQCLPAEAARTAACCASPYFPRQPVTTRATRCTAYDDCCPLLFLAEAYADASASSKGGKAEAEAEATAVSKGGKVSASEYCTNCDPED